MRIVLFYKKLNIGGAERSIIRLINEFAKEGHEAILFLHTKGGILDAEISDKVKLLYLYRNNSNIHIDKNIYKNIRKYPIDLCKLIFYYLCGKIKYIFYKINKIQCDLLLTGWQGYDPIFVNKLVKSKVHFQMLRSENAIIMNGLKQPFINKYDKQIQNRTVDGYICVSEYIRKLMIDNTSVNANRIYTIYNIISVPNFKDEDLMPYEYKQCKNNEKIVVTICRLIDGAKGLFRMVRVCKKLIDTGIKFKWFVVGDGIDKDKMKKQIDEQNLSNIMYLCGFKTNPIRYYIYSDLVAVLSYAE